MKDHMTHYETLLQGSRPNFTPPYHCALCYFLNYCSPLPTWLFLSAVMWKLLLIKVSNSNYFKKWTLNYLGSILEAWICILTDHVSPIWFVSRDEQSWRRQMAKNQFFGRSVYSHLRRKAAPPPSQAQNSCGIKQAMQFSLFLCQSTGKASIRGWIAQK